MAKQPTRTAPPPKGKAGKAGKGKPITSHQLFPAVVALWFGALFGLGSLAVRPSLLEGLVMKSRLDLVVPAAAPPLGITARILIALIMAALGSVLGVLIARRIARPKVEVRQRKRSAKSAEPEPRTSYFGQNESGSTFDEVASNGGVLAGRRRGSLAIEHDEVDFVPHEVAPLPGGAPQVLDISGIELTEHEPRHDRTAPLDLGAYAQGEPVPAAPLGDAAMQTFQPPAEAPKAVEEPYDLTPQAYLPAEPTPAQRQIFGMPVENDHVDQSFVREAGFKTSVFDTEEAEPLFPAREPQAGGSEPASAAFAPPEQAAAPAMPAAFAPPAAAQSAIAPVVAEAPAFAAPAQTPAFASPVPAAPFAPAATAPMPEAPAKAEQPAAAQPTTGLGMTDLASRLQQSMQRRRAARTTAPVEPEAAVAAPSAPDIAAPQPAETAPVAAAFAPPMAEEPAGFVPPADNPAVPAPFAPPAAEIDADFTPSAPFVAPFAVEAVTPPPPFAAPMVPASDPASLLAPAPVAAQPDPAAAIPPPPMAMPAALRPLNLEHELQDDDDMLASLLPPRHVPLAVQPTAPASALADAAPLAEPAAFANPAELAAETEESPEEESYASLLDIGQPLSARSGGFVRIEEPEAHDAAVEPVVIFPGQGAFAQPQQSPFAQPVAAAAAPGSAAGGEAVPFRRFDAPSAAGQGVPVAAQSGQQTTDPAEADQALRAALANLQRMSGAA